MPSGRSTPVLPPIDESIWATSVVGTWMNGTPRRYVAARNPAASPSAPPPIATSGSRPLDAQRGELAGGVLDHRQPLGVLALRQEDRLDRPARARGDRSRCRARRPPTRPARRRGSPGAHGESVSSRRESLGRDAVAEDDATDRGRRPEENRPAQRARDRRAAARRPASAAAERDREPLLDRVHDPVDLGDADLVDPRRRVEPLAPVGEVADRPDRVAAGDERTDVRRPAQPLGEDLRATIEPDRRPAAVQRPPIARIDDGAAAGGDDPLDVGGRIGRSEVCDRGAFEVAEMRLALVGEDLGDRAAGPRLDPLVHVDEGRAVPVRQPPPDNALAAARQPDEHDVHGLAQSSPPEPASSVPVRPCAAATAAPRGPPATGASGAVAIRAR